METIRVSQVLDWGKIACACGFAALFLIPFAIIFLKNLFKEFCEKWFRKEVDIVWNLENHPDQEYSGIGLEDLGKHKRRKERLLAITSYIDDYFCVDLVKRSFLGICYQIFWVLGGVICTFIAIVLYLYIALQIPYQFLVLKDIQAKNVEIAVTTNCTEQTLLKALKLNDYLEFNLEGDCYFIKTTVLEDFKKKYSVDEDAIRLKVTSKYKSAEEILQEVLSKGALE